MKQAAFASILRDAACIHSRRERCACSFHARALEPSQHQGRRGLLSTDLALSPIRPASIATIRRNDMITHQEDVSTRGLVPCLVPSDSKCEDDCAAVHGYASKWREALRKQLLEHLVSHVRVHE
eukprot:6203198-Pleurochrysis_carterae.AAC.3